MIVPLILFRRLFLRAPEVEISLERRGDRRGPGGGCSHESAACVVLDYGCRYAFEGFSIRERVVWKGWFPRLLFLIRRDDGNTC